VPLTVLGGGLVEATRNTGRELATKEQREGNDHEKNSSYVLWLNPRCFIIVFRIDAALVYYEQGNHR